MHNEDETLYDVRVVEYHIRRGKLSVADYEAMLAKVEDDAEHGEPTETRFTASYEDRKQAAADEEGSTPAA